nr:MAG TPA: hypothetical protein [Caudoviricetes sp.]
MIVKLIVKLLKYLESNYEVEKVTIVIKRQNKKR